MLELSPLKGYWDSLEAFLLDVPPCYVYRFNIAGLQFKGQVVGCTQLPEDILLHIVDVSKLPAPESIPAASEILPHRFVPLSTVLRNGGFILLPQDQYCLGDPILEPPAATP